MISFKAEQTAAESFCTLNTAGHVFIEEVVSIDKKTVQHILHENVNMTKCVSNLSQKF